MNNKQTAKKNMYNKLLVFFKKIENAAIWAAFQRLVDEIADFITNDGELEKFMQQQQQETKGVTTDKETLFLAAVNLVVKYARKARVWAEDINNATLEAVFDIRKDDFTKIAEDLASEKLKNVRKALNDNLASLGGVNVVQANIDVIDAAISAYEAAEGTPGAAESEKEAGTEGIEVIMDNMDKNLEVVDDLMVSEYEESNPAMVEEYLNNRKIETVGVHHQGFSADITYEDNTPAQGVGMRIVELNKSGISDILGHVENIRGKIGTYHIEFSGAGIETQTLIASIKRGIILNLVVKVKKVGGPVPPDPKP